MIPRALTVLLIILVCHLGGAAPAQSSPPMFDRSGINWLSLAFKSKKFLGTVNTRVVLEQLPADAVAGELIASHRGEDSKPSGAWVLHLTTNSTVDPLVGSDELLVTRVWFSPQELDALQRIRLRKGKEKWEKTYRWTQSGVYRMRLRPEGADEEDLPVERWTDKHPSFYSYDLEQSECSSVSDPSALLYVASAAGLAVGDPPRHLCAFNKKQLHRVQFQAVKSQLLDIDYLEKSQHGETRKDGEVEVLKISFTARSLSADEDGAEPFSFMGLKGDFDIYIDKASRIPVRISGKIPGIGKVEFKLGEVRMSPG